MLEVSLFRIEEGPDDGVIGSLLTYVVDHERGVWLKLVSGMGPEPGSVMKLVWGGRVIQFDYYVDNVKTEQGERLVGRIENFGTSRMAGYKADLRAFHFSSDTEREAAHLLAVEGLLVFGSMYNGLSFPDGMLTVELRTDSGIRLYKLSDFGYITPAADGSSSDRGSRDH